jgi:hypothetical protein
MFFGEIFLVSELCGYFGYQLGNFSMLSIFEVGIHGNV